MYECEIYTAVWAAYRHLYRLILVNCRYQLLILSFDTFQHLKHLVSEFTVPGGGVDSVAAVTEALKTIDSIKQICVEN